MNQEEIQKLVDRSRQDDKEAFGRLVSEFQSLVFRLSFRLLCDEDEAKRYNAGNIYQSLAITEII